MAVSEKTPPWVLLTREMADGAPTRAQLEAWEEVFRETPRDERILVGATCAVLRAPMAVRSRWIERLGLRSRWQALSEFPSHGELASAFLVLLHTVDEDRIAEFERRLGANPRSMDRAQTTAQEPIPASVGAQLRPAKNPLSSAPVRRAARAYVAALRRSKQWDRIRDLEKSAPAILRRGCRFKERELVRIMAELVELPDPTRERLWCEGWERLLSLELNDDEIVEVLDHFVNLRQALERTGHLDAERALYEDVTLQLLRRAKATGEALLERSPLRTSERDERRRSTCCAMRRLRSTGTGLCSAVCAAASSRWSRPRRRRRSPGLRVSPIPSIRTR